MSSAKVIPIRTSAIVDAIDELDREARRAWGIELALEALVQYHPGDGLLEGALQMANDHAAAMDKLVEAVTTSSCR